MSGDTKRVRAYWRNFMELGFNHSFIKSDRDCYGKHDKSEVFCIKTCCIRKDCEEDSV